VSESDIAVFYKNKARIAALEQQVRDLCALNKRLETALKKREELTRERDEARAQVAAMREALAGLELQNITDGDPVTFTWEELDRYRRALSPRGES
jgi:hypothetical protein